MTPAWGATSMVGELRRVVVKSPDEFLQAADSGAAEAAALGWDGPPDPRRAIAQHRAFCDLLAASGAEVLELPSDDRSGLDSIYTHDAGIVTPQGVVGFSLGKPARREEGTALAAACTTWDVPVIACLPANTKVEGGDTLWLDDETLAVGRGYRSDDAGITALRALLAADGIQVLEVALPHGAGPDECLHLQSLISFLDHRLALVHAPLLPVAFVELLHARAIELVAVAESEIPTLAANVLAVAPRDVIVVDGNPITRGRIEATGCRVRAFAGDEIAVKGQGGPTCLTRPLMRGS